MNNLIGGYREVFKVEVECETVREAIDLKLHYLQRKGKRPSFLILSSHTKERLIAECSRILTSGPTTSSGGLGGLGKINDRGVVEKYDVPETSADLISYEGLRIVVSNSMNTPFDFGF